MRPMHEDHLKKISAYPIKELIQFICDGIKNRGISPELEKEVTIFSSRVNPRFRLFDYITNLTTRLEMGSVGILSAYIYLMKYLEKTQIELTDFNIPRIVATVFVITQRYVYDEFYDKKTCINATGVQPFEMERLTKSFYEGIDFELYINRETWTTLTEHFDRYLASGKNPENAPSGVVCLELPFNPDNDRDKRVEFAWKDGTETHRSVTDMQRYTLFGGWVVKKTEVPQTPHTEASTPTPTS